MEKVIILASGGIDSLTVIAAAISEGKLPVILSFDYGQTNKIELEFLKKSLKQFPNYNKILHKIAKIDFSFLLDEESFSSSLIDQRVRVKKYNNLEELPNIVPNTYVPARNTIFISYAFGLAENLNITKIYLGIHKQDAPNYPDCTLKYSKAIHNLGQTGFKNKISVITPLINMNKVQIVELGKKLGVDYSNTLSCYEPINDKACHACHSCLIRDDALKANQCI